jgi:hypothetical protein
VKLKMISNGENSNKLVTLTTIAFKISSNVYIHMYISVEKYKMTVKGKMTLAGIGH